MALFKSIPSVAIKTIEDIPTSILLFLIFLLGIAVYSNSLNNGFFWDDICFIQHNPSLESNSLRDIFTQPLHPEFCLYYRPLKNVSFKLDFFFWKRNPFGYHLTNVILHLLNAVFLFKCIVVLLRDKLISFLSSVLFVVHPTISEVPIHISNRAYLLVLLFLLIALLFYLQLNQKNYLIQYSVAASSFVLALFSHEVAVVFPFFLLCYEYLNEKQFKNTALFFMLAFLFLILRFTVIPLHAYHFSQQSTLLTTPKVLSIYFTLMAFPFNLHKFWIIEPIRTIIGFEFMLSILFVASLLLLCGYLYRKRQTHLVTAIIWFIIMILPLTQMKSNFYRLPQLSSLWLYVSAFGFILCVSAAFARGIRSVKKIIRISSGIMLMCLLVLYCMLTRQQITLWANHTLFFETMIKNGITEPAYFSSLGVLYAQQGNIIDALETYERAISEYQETNDSNYNDELLALYRAKGILYLRLQHYTQASATFSKAVDLNPDDATNHYLLSVALLMSGKTNESLLHCKRALIISDQAKYRQLLNVLNNVEHHRKENQTYPLSVRVQ